MGGCLSKKSSEIEANPEPNARPGVAGAADSSAPAGEKTPIAQSAQPAVVAQVAQQQVTDVPPANEIAPVPNEIAPVLDEITPARNEITPVPNEIRPKLNETTPVSNKTAPAPNEIAALPNGIAPTLNEITPILNEITPTLNEITPTLNGSAPVPNEITPTLNGSAPAPNDRDVVSETATKEAALQGGATGFVTYPTPGAATASGSSPPKKSEFDLPLRIPFDDTMLFEGRTAELETIRKNLTARRSETALAICELIGIRGIGKTRLTVRYAYKHKRDYAYDAILWVNFSTEYEADKCFHQIAIDILEKRAKGISKKEAARGLNIEHLLTDDEVEELKASLELSGRKDLRSAVLDWLSLPQNNNWLLVLDDYNVDQTGGQIADFLKTRTGGSVIITSPERRDIPIPAGSHVEDVKGLDTAAGLEMLLKLSGRSTPSDFTDGEERTTEVTVLEKLEYVPLAIELAGAFIKSQGISIAQYNTNFDEGTQKMAELTGMSSSYKPGAIASACETALAAVVGDFPLAETLINECSLVAPKGIIEKMFSATEHGYDHDLNKRIDEAFKALEGISLVNRAEAGVYIHSAVQLWAGSRMDMFQRSEAVVDLAEHIWGSVFLQIDSLDPFHEDFDPVLEESHFTHISAFMGHLERGRHLAGKSRSVWEIDPEAEYCVNQIMVYGIIPMLEYRLAYPAAIEWYKCLRENYRREGQDTLKIEYDIAIAYNYNMQYGEARKQFEQILRSLEQPEVQESRDAERVRRNTIYQLAEALYYQEEVGEALVNYRSALRLFQEELGEDHEDTVAVVERLAEVEPEILPAT